MKVSEHSQPPESDPAGKLNQRRYVLLVGLLLSLFYLVLIRVYGFTGWIAWDEGCLGEMAERVLYGEYPHKHFDCMYTGLLSLMHAGWYRIFGIDLGILRWFVFLTNYVFLIGFYTLSLRLTKHVGSAALLTLMAIAWGVILYPTSMPSYQITFLTLGAALAAIAYHRTGQMRWLIVTGIACGLAILIKIIGLYLVMALGYFWIYDNQNRASLRGGWSPKLKWNPLGVGISLCLLLPPLMLTRLCSNPLVTGNLLYFVTPFLMLAAVIILREGRLQSTSFRDRCADLFRLLIPYTAGLAIAIVPFLVFYASIDGLGPLFNGVFIQPFNRLTHGAVPVPFSLWLIWAAVIFTALILPRVRRWTWAIYAAVFIVPVYILLASNDNKLMVALWSSIPWLTPMACALPLINVWMSPNGAHLAAQRGSPFGNLLILSCALASLSLVQFPYAATVYYLFVIPLVILTMTAHARLHVNSASANYVRVAIIIALIAFALIKLNQGPRAAVEITTAQNYHWIDTPRNGLRVPEGDFIVYYEIGQLLDKLAPNDEYIYAFPDVPQLYFLYGKRNPTRGIFDFLGRTQEDYASDETLQFLDDNNVNVVILYLDSYFSPPPNKATIDKLLTRYPYHTLSIGKSLMVLWRNPENASESDATAHE